MSDLGCRPSQAPEVPGREGDASKSASSKLPLETLFQFFSLFCRCSDMNRLEVIETVFLLKGENMIDGRLVFIYFF